MANLLIVAVALIIALSGVVAIVGGVVHEQAERRARRPRMDRARLADEIQSWLRHQ
jgi:hypothetical protein